MGTRLAASVITDPSKRYVMPVYWDMTTTDPIGQAFDMQGYFIAGAEWEGTPGPGFQGALQVSNKPASWGSPTQWTNVTGMTATSPGVVLASSFKPYAMQVRPSITGGDGTTLITCRIFLVAY